MKSLALIIANVLLAVSLHAGDAGIGQSFTGPVKPASITATRLSWSIHLGVKFRRLKRKDAVDSLRAGGRGILEPRFDPNVRAAAGQVLPEGIGEAVLELHGVLVARNKWPT